MISPVLTEQNLSDQTLTFFLPVCERMMEPSTPQRSLRRGIGTRRHSAGLQRVRQIPLSELVFDPRSRDHRRHRRSRNVLNRRTSRRLQMPDAA